MAPVGATLPLLAVGTGSSVGDAYAGTKAATLNVVSARARQNHAEHVRLVNPTIGDCRRSWVQAPLVVAACAFSFTETLPAIDETPIARQLESSIHRG
jgi:hypothetical protein